MPSSILITATRSSASPCSVLAPSADKQLPITKAEIRMIASITERGERFEQLL